MAKKTTTKKASANATASRTGKGGSVGSSTGKPAAAKSPAAPKQSKATKPAAKSAAKAPTKTSVKSAVKSAGKPAAPKKSAATKASAGKAAVKPAVKSAVKSATKGSAKKSVAAAKAAPKSTVKAAGKKPVLKKAAPAAVSSLQMQLHAHAAIASVPKGMAAGRSVLKVLSEALVAFTQAVGYTQSVILQLTPDETCLLPVCSSGEAAALIGSVTLDEPLEIMAEHSVSKILGKAWSSGACLPLIFQDTPLGLFCLGGGHGTRPDALQKPLLEMFAQQISLCLYTSNLSEYKDLSPEAADASRAELRAENVPMIAEFDASLHLLRGSECGGDFHAFLPLSMDRTCILFGKTSGSGMCGFDLTGLEPELKSRLSSGSSLPDAMQFINEEIIRQRGRGQLVSVVLMIVDSRTRKARICRAGSVKMLRFKGGELSVFDEALGPHLGAFSGVRLQEVELQFAPGDSLALMTDGINLFSEKKSAPLESLAEKLATRMANHRGVGLTGQIVTLLKEKHLPAGAEVTVLGLQRKSKPVALVSSTAIAE